MSAGMDLMILSGIVFLYKRNDSSDLQNDELSLIIRRTVKGTIVATVSSTIALAVLYITTVRLDSSTLTSIVINNSVPGVDATINCFVLLYINSSILNTKEDNMRISQPGSEAGRNSFSSRIRTPDLEPIHAPQLSAFMPKELVVLSP